jgi:hypothetical protein
MITHPFAYTPIQGVSGLTWHMPIVTLSLTHQERRISVSALVDSGAALNILPYDDGLRLGLNWQAQTFPLDVGGLLNCPAYAVLLQAQIDPFSPVNLAFAWVEKPSQQVRTLLGQINFFQEFDVWFSGSQQIFEIAPKGTLIKPTRDKR